MIELSDDRLHELENRAQERGVSAEQYVRQVLEHDLEAPQSEQSVAELMREIWRDMPEDTLAKLPSDGASQVDHYVYGLPKRDM